MTGIQTECNAGPRIEEDTKVYLGRVFGLLKRKSHLHWHIHFFRQYIEANINPQGLRIRTYPTLKEPSDSFKKDWERVLTNSSRELMKLLVSQYDKDLTQLDTDIERLNVQFQHIKETPAFTAGWQEMRIRLETLNKDIILKKQSKFNKDKLAFSEGRAYRWGGRPANRNFRTKSHPTHNTSHEDVMESDSSISSTMSQTISSRAPDTSQTRQRSGKRTYTKAGLPPNQSNKKRSDQAQANTMSNLTPILQNILKNGAQSQTPKTLSPQTDFLDPQTGLVIPRPSKKQTNLDQFVSQTPTPASM